MATGLRELNAPTLAPAVEVRGVRRRFGANLVLDDVSLSIAPGEFLVIVGQSGGGKSTLLRVIGGLDDGAEGEIAIEGTVAFGFQDARLLPWQRAWENVVFGIAGPRAERRSLAEVALAEVGLTARADAWPLTLSGGEAQRVALARSLVRRPSVLLLDEPFGALDALTRLRMQALVGNLWREHGGGTTGGSAAAAGTEGADAAGATSAPPLSVVLVTHDVEEALLLADRVVVLDRGRIADELVLDLPRPRSRQDPRFEELRVRILDDLGVSDIDAELTAHASPIARRT